MPKELSPEEVILAAFEIKRRKTLSLETLVAIAMSANCPSSEVAQGVLYNMVKMGLLTWEKSRNKVLFTLVGGPKH